MNLMHELVLILNNMRQLSTIASTRCWHWQVANTVFVRSPLPPMLRKLAECMLQQSKGGCSCWRACGPDTSRLSSTLGPLSSQEKSVTY